MSFILDALKKSEQERSPRGVPDLHTEHGPPSRAPKRRRLWPGLLVFALLLNAALLLWLLRPWSDGEDRPEARQAAVLAAAPGSFAPLPVQPLAADPVVGEPKIAKPAPSPAPPLSDPPAVTLSPVPKEAEVAEPRKKEVKETPVEAPRPGARKELPTFEGLPSHIRDAVPPFDISLHFYTETPSSRMVRINGRNLREGERVGEGLALERITPSGVILNWNEHRFRAGNY